MYLGEASVAHSRVDKFLRIAKFLGVSQLSDQCKADVFELNKEFSVNSHVEMNEETMAEEAPEAQNKTRKLVRTTSGNTKGIQDHMASKHDEYVDKYVKQRQKVETMKKQRKQNKIEFKNQQKRCSFEQSRIRLERKKRKEQKIESVKLEKIDKQHKEKELVLIQRAKKEELRVAKQKHSRKPKLK